MKLKIASIVIKSVIASLVGLIALGQSAMAGTISASNAVNEWVKFSDPRAGDNVDAWTVVEPDTIRYTQNRGQTLASDFIVDGSFSLKSQISSFGGDDDRYGLVFGFQDEANNYRFSWEGKFANNGYAEADGSRGLSLIREVDGTSVSLFNLDDLFWEKNVAYDITVQRTGSEIGFLVEEVGKGLLASTTVTDTTFNSGRVGIWNSSEPTDYKNLTLTEVPEPSTLLGLLAFGGMSASSFLFKRKQSKQVC